MLANTRTLLRAARAAAVERVVQFSVSNASETSPYGYFRTKALAERALRESGLAHAIVRPTLIFGRGELLSAEDVAELAVELAGRSDDVSVDSAGPAVYSFGELVGAVRRAIGARTRLVGCPPFAVLAAARAASVPRDVLIRRDELAALRDDLLVLRERPRSTTRLEEWLAEEASAQGRSFVSERGRNWS